MRNFGFITTADEFWKANLCLERILSKRKERNNA